MVDTAPTHSPAAHQATADAPAIVVEHLSHTYPAPRGRRAAGDNAAVSRPALGDVSLSVRAGEVFALLGPNGSGKTTLFRILATMLTPRAGDGGDTGGDTGGDARLEIFGADVTREPAIVRQRIGVVFQSPSLDARLTARENMRHHGRLYGLGGAELRHRIDDALALFNLTDRADERVERFSGGMRRRVEIAKAMLHDPKLLLLDEPSTGLDPGARLDLWRQLELLRQRGRTIALTTHLMDEADRCDRLAVMSEGRVVAVDSPGNLKSMIGGEVVTVTPRAGDETDIESLRGEIHDRFGPWNPDAAPAIIAGQVRMEVADGGGFIARLTDALPGRFDAITLGRPTLEDAFLHLTGRSLHENQPPTIKG